MDTQAALRELLNLIRDANPERIEPEEGLSSADIESAIKTRPIPETLIDLYLCAANEGSDLDLFESISLIPWYRLLGTEGIRITIEMFEEIRRECVDRDGEEYYHEFQNWEPDMIPFLHDGSGYYIFVRTLSKDRSVWVRPKADEMYKINTSLDRFILTAIECYKQGAYYQELDDDVLMWDTDEDLAQNIVNEIDPEMGDYSPP
jgi:hypothetical protein